MTVDFAVCLVHFLGFWNLFKRVSIPTPCVTQNPQRSVMPYGVLKIRHF